MPVHWEHPQNMNKVDNKDPGCTKGSTLERKQAGANTWKTVLAAERSIHSVVGPAAARRHCR